MHVVCTTGFYTQHEGWGLPFYWRARDPEEIAEHYVAEITEGIAGTDGIRAGAIKAATGVEVTDAERRVLAGAAHRRSGTPASRSSPTPSTPATATSSRRCSPSTVPTSGEC